MRHARIGTTSARSWMRIGRNLLVAIVLLIGPAVALAGDYAGTPPIEGFACHADWDDGEWPREGFFRVGAVFPVGKGALENPMETGWTLQAGLRKPLWCPHPWFDLFGELSGFYAHTPGDDTFVTTSGLVQAGPGSITVNGTPKTLGATSTPIPNFASTRIDTIERAGVQFAVGSYYVAPNLAHLGWNLLSDNTGINWRAGLRAGGIKVQYQEHPTPDLEDFIRQTNREGRDPTSLRFTSNVKEPELFVGLFGSVGIGTTWQNFWGHPWTVSIGAEIEIAIDYVDTGDYSKGDQGLATWSPMVSILIAW